MEYRINGYEQIKAFYSWVFNTDESVRQSHISLYMFLINQNNRSNWVEWFKCPYDLAMAGAAIGSRSTYYNCLADLKTWKLLDYKKGVNNYKAPQIKLIQLSNNAQLTGQVSVPLSEQVTGQLSEQLPEHIYKLITNNLKLVTDNLKGWISDEKLKLEYQDVFNPWEGMNGFGGLWDLWIKYRKEKNISTYKPIGLQGAYKKLWEISNGNLETATKIIHESISNGWTGFFELKNGQTTKTKTGVTAETIRTVLDRDM